MPLERESSAFDECQGHALDLSMFPISRFESKYKEVEANLGSGIGCGVCGGGKLPNVDICIEQSKVFDPGKISKCGLSQFLLCLASELLSRLCTLLSGASLAVLGLAESSIL